MSVSFWVTVLRVSHRTDKSQPFYFCILYNNCVQEVYERVYDIVVVVVVVVVVVNRLNNGIPYFSSSTHRVIVGV